MESAFLYWPLVLIAAGIVYIGVIVLEVVLSKMESKWPGLIMALAFSAVGLLISTVVTIFSILIGAAAIATILIWPLALIPGLILLLIYHICRKKQPSPRCKDSIEKMNILDLE